MLERLKPKHVIVYGRMPDKIFGPYKSMANFLHFESDLQKYFSQRQEEK
jgi:hypothetical protein